MTSSFVLIDFPGKFYPSMIISAPGSLSEFSSEAAVSLIHSAPKADTHNDMYLLNFLTRHQYQ